jgi:cell division protein FtsI (penicillin-binding protein 3)
VFQRVTQQVLEYLHVPHDMQLPPSRQVWLAQNKVKDSDLDESSPDHLGSSLDLAEAGSVESTPATPASPKTVKPSAAQGAVVPAAMRTKESTPEPQSKPSGDRREAGDRRPATVPAISASEPAPAPSNETVVLDVEQGGIEVPSFIGKSVRASLELAQDSGLELNLVGSGIAREQSPAPGTHVTAGSRVLVKFGR